MHKMPRTGSSASLEAFVGMATRNIVEGLANLHSAVGEIPSAGNDPSNWPKSLPLETRRVLHDVVATLERTKSAFKSKELGELRRKLEGMLQA